MKNAVLIQARSSSERLPGKVFEEVAGRPILLHVFERMKAAGAGPVFFVIPEGDERVAAFLEAAGIPFLRGPLDDVRERYRLAARTLGLDGIVRATADNPFLDPQFVRPSLERLSQGLDLFSFSGLPLGMGVEVFTRAALDADGLDGPEYREHVSLHIKHDSRFRVAHDPYCDPLPEKTPRVTVDTPEDLLVVRAVAERLGSDFGAAELMKLYAEDRGLFEPNSRVEHRVFPRPK